MFKIKKKDINFYLNYLFIAYAFCMPISKAGVNLFEFLIFLFWIIEGKWKEKFDLYKKNLLSIAVLSLIGFSLLSILWQGNIETTIRYIAKYRHLLIIFVFYSSFNKKYTFHIFSAFLLAMFISELMSYGIFFEIIHYKNILPSDPTPFMSHMTYSTILAFTISILLVRFIYEKNLKYRLFYILFFISATINLFINGGRTGQIIFIILIFIVTFSSMKYKLKAFIVSISTLLIIFFLAYNFSPNFNSRSNNLYNGIINIFKNNNYNASGGYRAALTTVGIDTFLDNPILGTGIAYNMYNVEKYAKLHNFGIKDFNRWADYHSTFITISAQLGIIGLIISLLIIYSLLCFKIKNKELKLLSILFAISFIMFSFTHNTLHTMNPMVFFVLFTGLFNAISKEKIEF